jgi:hypothetical protein
MDVMFVINDLPTNTVEHVGILVDLSVRIRVVGFIDIHFKWGSILRSVNIHESISYTFCKVHDTVLSVGEQCVGFVELVVIEVFCKINVILVNISLWNELILKVVWICGWVNDPTVHFWKCISVLVSMH